MPPKATRGGAARGRRPARGRGGKATAAGIPPALTTEPKESESESQSTIADTPMPDAEPAENITPVHQQSEEQNDPNYSPATPPTETPAPTPVRLPPVVSNTNGAASGSGTRGGAAAKPSKFKPKIVRANAKEREEREAREKEKENARLGAAAASAARAARGTWGRGRGSRGRGDAMGRGRGVHTSGTASGPFAEAPASNERKGFFSGGTAAKREPGASYSRGSGSGASGSAVKTEGTSFIRGSNGRTQDLVAGRYIPEPQYPDEDDEAPRVDIEHINEQSDSEEDVIVTGVRSLNKDRRKMSNKGGLKPIRLDRKEHKERVTMVNTEPTVKSAPEGEKNDPDMVIDENSSSKAIPPKREWKGTYDDEVQIKSEPGIIPDISSTREPTGSARSHADVKAALENRAHDPDVEPEPTNPRLNSPVTGRMTKARRPSKRKDKMPVIQTEEDRAEWERHLEDMDIIRKELSGMAANLQPKNKGKDVEGDVDMNAQEAPGQEKEDGRVYLFQFPPVLPKLYNATTSSNPNNIIDDDDVEMMISFDLTKDDKAEIKSEEKVIEIKQEELDEDEVKKQREREKLVVEEGAIGKLVLRESGAVELVWGGTNMKVERGIETNFFSLGAVVDGMGHWQKDERGKDLPAANGSQGKSMAMGEIMGKFVVTPDLGFY